MKTYNFFTALLVCISAFLSAQTPGTVGINNAVSSATLDLTNLNTTTSTVDTFRVINSSNTYIFDVADSGVAASLLTNTNADFGMMASGTNASTTNGFALAIKSLNQNAFDFAIEDPANPTGRFLKHIFNTTAGTYSGSNFGGQAIVFSSGGQSINGVNNGLYIGTYSNVAGGIFIGENGLNGIGLNRAPTATLDINGPITISNYDSAPTAVGSACTRIGEIAYNTHIWGCTSNGWQQLDN